MAAVNNTNFDAAIKQTWPQKRFNNVFETKYALMAKMPKDPTFLGGAANLALRYANSAGASASFGNAQANMSGVPLVRFTYTRVKDYSLFSVDGETLATAVKPDAVVDALDTAIESATDACHRRTAAAIYGSGTGQIGVISAGSSTASATITLSNPDDIVNFWPGQKLNSVTGTTLNSGTVTVSTLDRTNGTITVSEASWATGIPAAAPGDLIVMDGDYNLRVSGLDAWLRPTGSTTPGTLFTVNRNVDPVLLAGNYYDASSTTMEDGLIKIAQLVSRYGGRVTDFFMNDADMVKLSYSMGTRVRLDDSSSKKWGINAMQIVTAGGSFNVYGDPFCPLNRGYALQMDTWKFRSAGQFPRFLMGPGGDKIQLEVSSDAVQGRLGGYSQVICDAPAWNGVVKFA